MIRWWAFRRRVEYIVGLLVFFTLVGSGIYYMFGYQSPTCFDNTQNGKERGIDCGGVCQRMCLFEIQAPRVLWTKAFKIVDGQYNAVAYIENGNKEVGTKSLPYTITLSDNTGVIVERSGVTLMPPDGVYPIFEGRIQTGSRVPTRADIVFTDEQNVVWVPADTGRDKFSVVERDLADADNKPRLTTQIRNSLLSETKEVEIIATLFDSKGKPLTAARTVVEYFKGRSTEKVVFTWPEPIAKTLRSCEVPSDVMLAIDLSGSMNDDGGDPPQPVSSVLKAAESFINRLKKDDQVGVVTYATDAIKVSPLSGNVGSVAEIVSELRISKKEETGSTNPGDALKQIQNEMLSNHHNPDARKIAILFTDGLANAPLKNPEGYATSSALELKNNGVDIFTVGLGSKLNQKFLQEIASDAQHAFIAPTAQDVDDIYRTISSAICEDGTAVIEIIAKPSTSFE